MKACRKIITYKCNFCGNIIFVKKSDDVPYKCKAVVKSKAFKSGAMKCGGLMIKVGEFEDKKVSA